MAGKANGLQPRAPAMMGLLGAEAELDRNADLQMLPMPAGDVRQSFAATFDVTSR